MHLLKAETSGPDGFATWKDAATDERVRRVKAEAEAARLRAAGRALLACPHIAERDTDPDWVDAETKDSYTLPIAFVSAKADNSITRLGIVPP